MKEVTESGWQTCPKCFGQGYVWFPPNLPLVETVASDGNPYCCDVCNGVKIVNIKTGQPPEAKEKESFTKDDIDLAYCAGIWNTGGIDVLGKELERLKHIDRKPHQIFQRYKPETSVENATEYLNECIEKADPNLSKIKDVDKELEEIRGAVKCCNNCKHYSKRWHCECMPYCLGSGYYIKWEPKTE